MGNKKHAEHHARPAGPTGGQTDGTGQDRTGPGQETKTVRPTDRPTDRQTQTQTESVAPMRPLCGPYAAPVSLCAAPMRPLCRPCECVCGCVSNILLLNTSGWDTYCTHAMLGTMHVFSLLTILPSAMLCTLHMADALQRTLWPQLMLRVDDLCRFYA